ncbi:MAG: hypothetical protein R3B13_32515 [Polyangiaceae bacterium]
MRTRFRHGPGVTVQIFPLHPFDACGHVVVCHADGSGQNWTKMKQHSPGLENIVAARTAISQAESNLAKLLGELRAAPRAQKTQVSQGIEEAFAKLRGAREVLLALEGSLVRGGTQSD